MTRVRRCSIVLIQPREEVGFDLDALLAGGTGITLTQELVALAPHLGVAVPITSDEGHALGVLPASSWTDRAACGVANAVLDGLVEKGLVVTDGPETERVRERDERLRGANWQAASAVLHYLGRWENVDAERNKELAGFRRQADLAEKLGAPPPAVHAVVEPGRRVPLARATVPEMHELLRRRVTCRNFDRDAALPHETFAALLHTVLGVQAVHEVGPDNLILKKNTPSGGGLHPFEAYVLIRRVADVEPGLYHYHALDHALEPIAAMPVEALDALATRFVAGQHYFGGAPVLVALAARFARKFWKYRNHAKGYRTLALEAGHISQTFYVCATQLGLGAFVTAAINEIEIERAFGLDPIDESPLAVCGFGPRAATRETVEFDPNRAVWANWP